MDGNLVQLSGIEEEEEEAEEGRGEKFKGTEMYVDMGVDNGKG